MALRMRHFVSTLEDLFLLHTKCHKTTHCMTLSAKQMIAGNII